ncbi:oxidoreductase [Brevibacillus sp. SYSU BS000544]|uniref:oxidoreductase n=1 Tax=Brevibacillus sp. SYSU BS000544 TaxID=3416443 RepID=UPI003CE5266C
MSLKSALLFGASGLVGSHLLQYLLRDERYYRIDIVVRTPLPLNHPKLQQHVIDFHQLEQHRELFAVDHVFCCLGTTIKKAKSREAFIQVDKTYPLEIAYLAKASGVQQFHVITAMGSNSTSSLFYNRVKGELENELRKIDFPSLLIYRPSLLLGDRHEFRLGEKIGSIIFKAASFVMIGPLAKYKAIEANIVAKGMLHTAHREKPTGVVILESEEIRRIATAPEEYPMIRR